MIQADHPSRTADELDRAPLAARVKDVIVNLRPDDQGFTISIEGRWGDGKSWIVDRLKTELIGSAQVVEFNPWLIGKQGALLAEFFACLLSNLKSTNTEKLKTALKKYARRLAKGAQDADDEVASAVGHLIDAALPEKDELESLTDLRADLVAKLRALPNKIVVIVDDIDRLSPREVVEVIRLIKAVGELPNVIYVIALDPEYVESALRNAGHGQYDNYLDKIIQLRVAVPPLRYPQKWKLLNHELINCWESSMISTAPGGKDACEYRLSQLASSIAKVAENPRDIKRIWNRFVFVEPSCRGEVNPIDLLALQALYIKAPNIYDEICRFPERFTHGEELIVNSSPRAIAWRTLDRNEKSSTSNEEVESTFLKELLSAKTQTTKAALSKLIYDVFPFLEWGEFKQNGKKENGHLDNLRVLRVALNAGGLEEQWTLNEIDELLNEPTKQFEILKKSNSFELALDLYDQLDDWNINAVLDVNLNSLIVELAHANAILNNNNIDEQFAKVIKTWSKRKYLKLQNDQNDQNDQNEALEWLYKQIVVLLNSSRLNIAYKLLRAEYYEQLNSRISVPEDAKLIEVLDVFAQKLIYRLDKDELKPEPDAVSMIWSLKKMHPTAFNSLADNEARFEKWFDIEAASPGCVSNGDSGRFEFHRVSLDRIDGYGGMQKIEPYLSKIESQGSQSISQRALANAYRQPEDGFDVATGAKIRRN